jgi:hypothetical protein
MKRLEETCRWQHGLLLNVKLCQRLPDMRYCLSPQVKECAASLEMTLLEYS